MAVQLGAFPGTANLQTSHLKPELSSADAYTSMAVPVCTQSHDAGDCVSTCGLLDGGCRQGGFPVADDAPSDTRNDLHYAYCFDM